MFTQHGIHCGPRIFFGSQRNQIRAFQVTPEILDVGMEVDEVCILANSQLTGDRKPEHWFQVLKQGYKNSAPVLISGKFDVFVTPSNMPETSFSWKDDPEFRQTNPQLVKAIEDTLKACPGMPLINLRCFFGIDGCTMDQIKEEYGLDEFWIFETPKCRIPPALRLRDDLTIFTYEDGSGVQKTILAAPQGEYLEFLMKEKLRLVKQRENEEAEDHEALRQMIERLCQKPKNPGPATTGEIFRPTDQGATNEEDPYAKFSRG